MLNSVIQKGLNTIQDELERAQHLEDTIANREREVKALKAECDALSANLERARSGLKNSPEYQSLMAQVAEDQVVIVQLNSRLKAIEHDYDAMAQSFKKLKIYTDLEAERNDLRKELTNLKAHRKLEAERAEVIRAGEEASWHNLKLVNTKLEKQVADSQKELEAARARISEQNNVIINRDSTIRLLRDEINGIQEAYKNTKPTPTHYWEVTVKLRDGRLGTYAILDWPRNIKADEVFRDDVTLNLHRVS